MGCLFSSTASEAPSDRSRVDAVPSDPLIPSPTATTSPTMNLPRQTPTVSIGNNPSQAPMLGTSYTDQYQRLKQTFTSVVQHARRAFIDISTQQRVQVTPLHKNALELTANCESHLCTVPIVNIPNGFFDGRPPPTVFSSIDTSPDSTAPNSIQNIVSVILGDLDTPSAELAYACSQEVCIALGEGAISVVQESLIISREEFESA